MAHKCNEMLPHDKLGIAKELIPKSESFTMQPFHPSKPIIFNRIRTLLKITLLDFIDISSLF